jgi:hypothetical protein
MALVLALALLHPALALTLALMLLALLTSLDQIEASVVSSTHGMFRCEATFDA